MKRRRPPVVWTSIAEGDLAGIVSYLHRESPSAARNVLERIDEQVSSLRAFPHRGRIVPELEALEIRSYRELIIPPHRLIYGVHPDKIVVLAVLDSRRDLEDLLLRRLLGD